MGDKEIGNYRPYIFRIAYNMLGDISASEDLVQDVFEKYLKIDISKIKNLKYYLAKITVNLAIDYLNKLKLEREAYKGIWMPVPLIGEVPEEESLDYALLFILEKLNPQERAVFVMNKAFKFSHDEISKFLSFSPENSRQLLHRASEKISSYRKPNKVDKHHHKQLLEAFLLAVYQKDFKQLQIFSNRI